MQCASSTTIVLTLSLCARALKIGSLILSGEMYKKFSFSNAAFSMTLSTPDLPDELESAAAFKPECLRELVWSSIRAIRGDITKQSPPLTTAGS